MSAVKVVVTGATGQVAYALLPRIASGEMFGPDTDIDLRLSDIPQMIDKAKGVLMELEDGAYPLLERVSASADRAETHGRADWVLLVGSVPRGPGMERGDLIRKNGPIFVEEGQAIQRYASSAARVVVVGNPCNTNCLIARANAHTVPDDRWSAMTRLDQNRARSLLAAKAVARVRDVKKLAIWGNHSATLYPDFTNAEVNGKRADQVVDRKWLETEYIPQVQQRGAAVIAARGASSAFSAAQALVDHVRSLITPTPKGDCFSAAIVSDGSYGVPKGLVSSFPLHSKGDGGFQIVPNVPLDDFAKTKIGATVAELEKERDLVRIGFHVQVPDGHVCRVLEERLHECGSGAVAVRAGSRNAFRLLEGGEGLLRERTEPRAATAHLFGVHEAEVREIPLKERDLVAHIVERQTRGGNVAVVRDRA